MACNPEVLKQVPLFALLDEEELAVLAGQIGLTRFSARQRIYKRGEAATRAYVVLSGAVRISTVDEDQQEVVVDQPGAGEFFGFASMIDQTPRQTSALALEETVCVEVERNDIMVLLQRKPLAGMDLLAALGRQIHAAQQLVRSRSARNPNEVIEEQATFGNHVADAVARFGGSWSFILCCLGFLAVYVCANVSLGHVAWDPYPFILLNLFLSMLAAIQAPIIMMSQNRQDAKDRVRSELDYEVNRHAAADIQGLARKVNLLGEHICDLEDLVRDKPIAR
jgi:CRP/FNR family transcriptional regulator, cyclic AMP receptor protein